MDWSSQSFPRHKKEIYFKGQKRKWWPHSFTVGKSLTKDLFRQVTRRIRKYCLVWF
jgi:hypothetical protein